MSSGQIAPILWWPPNSPACSRHTFLRSFRPAAETRLGLFGRLQIQPRPFLRPHHPLQPLDHGHHGATECLPCPCPPKPDHYQPTRNSSRPPRGCIQTRYSRPRRMPRAASGLSGGAWWTPRRRRQHLQGRANLLCAIPCRIWSTGHRGFYVVSWIYGNRQRGR